MRRSVLALLMIIGLLGAAIFLPASGWAGDDAGRAEVVAYYFHGNARCPTCHKLEAYSKEAIENNFKDALRSGELTFKAVNVEDKGNEHYMVDYGLYTKSLVLSSVKDGKEAKWKNLDKIWEYVRDKQKFIEYVTKEVGDFLK